MALNTYSDLIAGIQQWVEDDDAELQASINDVVDLGEKRLIRDLDLAIFRRVETAALVISQATIAKPTVTAPDLLVATKQIWLTGGTLTGPRFLMPRSSEYITDYNSAAVDGVPKYWGEDDESNYIFGTTPDAAYTANVRILSRPEPLSDTNENGWLVTYAYDILFKACLAEAEGFIKSDDRKPVWEADYANSIPLAKRELGNALQTHPEMLAAASIPQAPRSAI